jgi:hypothetical protein
MRGQRLHQRTFEKSDHPANHKGAAGRAKWNLLGFWFLVSGFWFFTAGIGTAGETETTNPTPAVPTTATATTHAAEKPETKDSESWRVILEPKSMHREIAWEIPGAERTVFAPIIVDGDDYLFPSKKVWDQFHLSREEIERRAAANAAADLATLQPRYERNSKKVIEYAELNSDRPIVASAVLAPKFLDLFRNTLGDKVLVVVPNRYTAYVFPALASDYRDYYSMVYETYHLTAWPISLELFEVSKKGWQAVGVYERP